MKEWYVFVENNQYGPVDIETLKKWIEEGRVVYNSFIWDYAEEEWKMASLFKEFEGAFKKQAELGIDTDKLPKIQKLKGTRVYFKGFREGEIKRGYLKLPQLIHIEYYEVNPITKQPFGKPQKTVLLNISPGGLAFETVGHKIDIKKFLKIVLYIPGLEKPIEIITQVTRVTSLPDRKYLIASGFREATAEDKEELMYYIRRIT